LGTRRPLTDTSAVSRARTLAALQIASRVLEFADPESPVAQNPHGWADAARELNYLQLEALHTAVMRARGFSWAALSYEGAPRQVLHRRLADRVDVQTKAAIDTRDDPQIDADIDALLADIASQVSSLQQHRK
jgi:hypothetical protein